jgi:hypothetical protein
MTPVCSGAWDCPHCDAAIARIEWHRGLADPGDDERLTRRGDAWVESIVFGEET